MIEVGERDRGSDSSRARRSCSHSPRRAGPRTQHDRRLFDPGWRGFADRQRQLAEGRGDVHARRADRQQIAQRFTRGHGVGEPDAILT